MFSLRELNIVPKKNSPRGRPPCPPVSGKVQPTHPSGSLGRVIGNGATEATLEEPDQVRMWGPKVLKDVYRRDDCLDCEAVGYRAVSVAVRAVECSGRAAESPSPVGMELEHVERAIHWLVSEY